MNDGPTTDAAIAAIREVYTSQHIRSQPLGFGNKPAALVVDFQNLYTRGRASTGLAAVKATARLLRVMREAGAPILYTVVAYTKHDRDTVLWTRKLPGLLDNKSGSPAARVDRLIAPQPSDWLIEKKAASAFTGTRLHTYITRKRIDTLVVCGTSTSGCVRASVVEGMGRGFRMMVVRECVSDRSPVLHELALFDMNTKYADVIGLDQALAHFEARSR